MIKNIKRKSLSNELRLFLFYLYNKVQNYDSLDMSPKGV